jgi:dTMP kinase
MEEQPPAFYEAVRRGYLELAAADPGRIRLLDAARPEKEIARKVLSLLQSYAIFEGIVA